MKVSIESSYQGELSDSIVDAVKAVMAAAIADGASKEHIQEEIAKAIGSNKISKDQVLDARWKFVMQAFDESGDLYRKVMSTCISEVSDAVITASKEASLSSYRKNGKV